MKRRSIFWGIILVFAFTFNSFADSNLLIKEYEYESSLGKYKDEKYMNMEFDEGGKAYKAKSVKYSIKKYVDAPGKITKSSTLKNKNANKEIKENGFKYELANATYNENKKTHKEVFTNIEEVPKTFEIKLETGEAVMGVLASNETRLSETLDKQLRVPGIFYGDSDVSYYIFNGNQIPADTAPYFDGYQSVILGNLGLNSNDNVINNAAWASDYYVLDGQIVRNAVFTGLQKSRIDEASYEYLLYDTTAEYRLADEKAKVIAVAKVEFEEVGLSLRAKITIAIGIIVIAAAISCALLVFRKKRK